MATGAGIDIHLVVSDEHWQKLLVILEDCAPVAYYESMANSLIQQGYKQRREEAREKKTVSND